jgi:hypothetical protein
MGKPGADPEARSALARIDPRTGLEDLDREECLRLVRASKLGRLAVLVDGMPLVFPVNFTIDGSDVVLRTDEQSRLYAARGSLVAFECDAADGTYHTGWSVIITGPVDEVLDPLEFARLQRLPLGPWCPGPKPVFLRIHAHAVTGRRIPLHGMRRAGDREGTQ